MENYYYGKLILILHRRAKHWMFNISISDGDATQSQTQPQSERQMREREQQENNTLEFDWFWQLYALYSTNYIHFLNFY